MVAQKIHRTFETLAIVRFVILTHKTIFDLLN
jgi:hypothetical protein